MKTVSFGIANYCVPCHAYCRYCLLSSCGKATGVNADEGMGFARRVMQEQRITRQEFDSLPGEIRDSFQRIKHMTESEWLSSGKIMDSEKRSLTLVLTPENMEYYRSMPAVKILNELECMDNQYLSIMPSAGELADRYGDAANQQLFRFRDLLLKWQQQYISESGDTLYDMHNETHSFSVHL